MGEVARVVVYGDIHLHSKNYGAHRDYAQESLECFRKVLEVAKVQGATHVIGLGDFSYGRFHTLEYREQVEKILDELEEVTGRNHFSLKGNHDCATYGMTEFEYYENRGKIKRASHIDLGNVRLHLRDHGKMLEERLSYGAGSNILLAHEFIRFKDMQTGAFGAAIEIDEESSLQGIDYIICGHIHSTMIFKGSIAKEEGGETQGEIRGKEVVVHYPGCLTRPSYREGAMPLEGQVVLLIIYDDRQYESKIVEIELRPLDEVFNIEGIEKGKIKKESGAVDISDVIKGLSAKGELVGNTEDIIMNLSGVDKRYRKKAIELMQIGEG